MSCPSDEILRRFLSDALPAEERPTIEKHIEVCASCRKQLDHLTTVSLDKLLPSLAGRSASTSSWQPGEKVGPYLLREELGRGGTGVVYRAWDDRVDREVALKVLKYGRFATTIERDRFLSEVRSAARVRHAGIVAVFDADVADGVWYFAMELMAGGPLSSRLANNPVAASDAAQFLVPVVRAVQHAHENGIIHRDIKPGNILLEKLGILGQLGTAKVADFGLAKAIDAGMETTASGAFCGTPAYMAPEQAIGTSGRCDVRTDIWNLGTVLYELLTGHPPFRGANDYETLTQVRDRDPVPPRKLRPSIPKDLQTICLKCLEKDPLRRYVSAEALADDLDRFLRREPVHARPVSVLTRVTKWARRYPSTACLLGTLFLVGIGLILGAIWFGLRLEEARAEAVWRAHETSTAEQAAQAATVEAVRERDRATEALSLGQIRLIAREIEAGNGPTVGALLEEIPTAFRDWEWGLLKRRAEGSYAALRGHRGEVRAVAVNSFGDRIASAGQDGTLRIWDGRSGQSLETILLSAKPISSIAFAPNGHQIATGGEDGLVRLYDLQTHKVVQTFTGHQRPVTAVSFADGGRSLISGAGAFDKAGEISRWDVATGRLLFTREQATAILSLAVEAGGKRIITGSGNLLTIHDGESGEVLKQLKGHQYGVNSVDLNSDRAWVATGEHDPVTRVWDLATSQVVFADGRPVGAITCVRFDPSGTQIASAGADGCIRVTNLLPGGATNRLTGHDGRVLCLAYMPDGHRLVSGGDDGLVRLWTVGRHSNPLWLCGHTTGVTAQAIDETGQYLATGGFEGWIKVWDVRTGRELHAILAHEGQVTSVCFIPSTKYLVSAGDDRRVRVWNLESGKTVREWETNPGPVRRIAVNSDGTNLATVGDFSSISIRDTRTWEERYTHDMGRNAQAIAFSPNGQTIAIGDRDGNGWLVQAINGTAVGPFAWHVGAIADIIFSADGQTLFTGGSDRVVKRWTLDGHSKGSAFLHRAPVQSVAVNPTGTRLATAGPDGAVKIWDVRSGAEILTISAHDGATNSITFTPDGRQLVSAGNDRIVRIWESRNIPSDPTNDPRERAFREFAGQFRPVWHAIETSRLVAANNWFGAANNFRQVTPEWGQRIWWVELARASAATNRRNDFRATRAAFETLYGDASRVVAIRILSSGFADPRFGSATGNFSARLEQESIERVRILLRKLEAETWPLTENP